MVLQAAGADLKDVLKTTVFMLDISQRGVTQRVTRPLLDIRRLQRLTIGYCLTEARLARRNVELAKPRHHLIVKPGCLPEFKPAQLLPIVEDRTSICGGELDRPIDDGL